jgi:hypothetical protein
MNVNEKSKIERANFDRLRENAATEALIKAIYPEVKTKLDKPAGLNRILKRLLGEQKKYESFYEFYRNGINNKPSSSSIKQKEERIEEAIRSLQALPSEVMSEADEERIHSVLKNINNAAQALLYLQQHHIELLTAKCARLEKENEHLKVRRVVTRQTAVTQTSGKDNFSVKLQLLNLHKQNKLPAFQTKRGRGATDSDVWIRKTLAGLSFSKEDIEIAIADPAVWYNVDKVLYQSRSMRNVRANKLTKVVGDRIASAVSNSPPKKSEKSDFNFA